MKRISLIFILIFSLSFFCACKSETFTLPKDCIFSEISFYQSGEISQTIGIAVDSQYIDSIAKAGESVQFKSNLCQQLDGLRQKFLLSFALVYLQNPIEELKIGGGVKLTPTSYKQEYDMICFDMIFSSTLAWQYYHNALGQEGQNVSRLPSLLQKKSNTSLFPFSSKDADGVIVGQGYKNIYLSASKGLSFEEELSAHYNPMYVYQYATHTNKIKSDAKYKFSGGGQYYHIWVAQDEHLEDKTTTIYYYQINKGNWLLLALTIPTIVLILYLICLKLKTKKERKG